MSNAHVPSGTWAHLPAVDAATLRRWHGILAPFVRWYFRSEVRGMEHVPATQTIVVTHHDGGMIPFNGFCFALAWHDRFGFERLLYTLSHDILHDVSARWAQLLAAWGVIRADRESMDAAMAAGASVLIFPGAARETFRTYWRRKDIDLGGRTGFVRQAIRWQVPITPVVCAGSHETMFVLHGGHALARKLGLRRIVRSADALPLLAGLPWGVWVLPFLPQWPLPAKMTTEVLPPVDLSAAIGRPLTPADADDPSVVQAAFDLVLARMREALARLYAERTLPVLG